MRLEKRVKSLQRDFPKSFYNQRLIQRALGQLQRQSVWWNRIHFDLDFLDMAKACPPVR
jgi:hypothetical protein